MFALELTHPPLELFRKFIRLVRATCPLAFLTFVKVNWRKQTYYLRKMVQLNTEILGIKTLPNKDAGIEQWKVIVSSHIGSSLPSLSTLSRFEEAIPEFCPPLCRWPMASGQIWTQRDKVIIRAPLVCSFLLFLYYFFTIYYKVSYFVNIARIANAVQVTICLLVSTSVY